MLERDCVQKNSKLGTSTTLKFHSQNALQDMILSLNHRISAFQNSLSSKIDRAQCMIILQSKPSLSQIKKITQQISFKLENQRRITQEKIIEQQKTNKKQLAQLKQKLKSRKKQLKKGVQDKVILGLKPQQLYLESNETMFGLIVDQITAIKQAQQLFEKNLQQRNKVTLSLNNEVCEKLQNLERQIQIRFNIIKDIPRNLHQSTQSWTNSEQKSVKMKQTSKSNFQKTETNIKKTGNILNNINLETYQISHIMRTIQIIQKQLASKINIKDVLPIIKKNILPVSQTIEEVKRYSEQAIESTKKILINQSQINQQLCTVSKLGWWQSFESKNGLAVWNKQISNLIPQNFIFEKDSTQIILVQQGTYILKILTNNDQIPEYIIIGGNTIEFIGENLIKVERNMSIQIPSSGQQMFVSIQKI